MPGEYKVIIEIAGALMQLIMGMFQKAGMTAEEAKRVFDEEFAKFQANKPENLPNV
jgi:hypothetical protein